MTNIATKIFHQFATDLPVDINRIASKLNIIVREDDIFVGTLGFEPRGNEKEIIYGLYNQAINGDLGKWYTRVVGDNSIGVMISDLTE